MQVEKMVEIVNSNGLDIDFHHNGSEYVIDYKTTQKGSEKKVDFKVVDEELIRTAVTCGCTSVEDVTKNSFSINYKKDRTESINQVVTLTFKSGNTAEIRLSGYVTT